MKEIYAPHFRLRCTHHSWSPRVVSAEKLVSRDTNMWGRVVESEFVRCQKEHVCTVCGAVRPAESCRCDCAVAEECPVLQGRGDH
jgi:hypothetical protein